jgi:DNA-binding transcriptional LysR family regulator
MPTLRQLEYLVTVAELGSFTRAAAELHVSQPTLSSQIGVLEREVGAPLLDRLPRTVRLTPAGRALVPHARSALAEARRTLAAARQTVGLDVGELDVAAVHSATLGLLPVPLRRWRLSHPGVRLRLREYRHGDDMTAAMRNGEADVAIGPTPADWPGDVADLGDEELVVVLASDDPLGERPGPVELSLLADRNWVHFVSGHGLAELLDAACATAGFVPKVALRVEQTAGAPLLSAAGLGPTLVPASIISADFDGLVLATSPPTRRTMAVYHRANGDPMTAAFARSVARDIELMPAHVATRLRRVESTSTR